MSAVLLRVEAPSDAQLDLIARLCREQGWTPPGAIYSKAEASEIIGAMFASAYTESDYRAPSAAPTHDDADYFEDDALADDFDRAGFDSEDVPF